MLFLMPIATTSFGIEYLLRRMPNDYKFKADIYAERAADFEILCLGNSHSYYGVNPLYFKRKAFNGSHVAQSLNIDLLIFRKYEPRMKNLKYVLIPISYISLSSKLENGAEAWRAKNYTLYYDGLYVPDKIINYSELLGSPFTSIKNRIKSYYLKQESSITSDNSGYGTNYKSKVKRDLIKTGKMTAEKHTVKDFSNFPENEKSLKEIIRLCADSGIKVILFTPPAYVSYKRYLDTVQLNRTIRIAASYEKNYKNLSYYNFLNDTTFVANDYFDADHLNEFGAEKLSKKLNQIIMQDEQVNH